MPGDVACCVLQRIRASSFPSWHFFPCALPPRTPDRQLPPRSLRRRVSFVAPSSSLSSISHHHNLRQSHVSFASPHLAMASLAARISGAGGGSASLDSSYNGRRASSSGQGASGRVASSKTQHRPSPYVSSNETGYLESGSRDTSQRASAFTSLGERARRASSRRIRTSLACISLLPALNR